MRGSIRLRQFHVATTTAARAKLIPSNKRQPTPTHNPKNDNDNKPSNIAVSDSDVVRWNTAISSHMRQGNCDAALRVFNGMPRRSVVTHNAMISGYLANDRFDHAREVFDKMPERDLVSWNVMIAGHVRNRDLGGARKLFNRMPERDVVSWNSMLSGYANHGHVREARAIFDRIPVKNDISWNGLLAAYVRNGRVDEARALFESRQSWELVSWNTLMGGLIRRKRLAEARSLFDRMPARDSVSWNTAITGYAQVGDMAEARRLFEAAPARDVFAWTAMVSGYVNRGKVDEARAVFEKMPARNVVSWNAMVAGYVSAGRMDEAGELFDAMPARNLSSWNTMITGYSRIGEIARARGVFDAIVDRDAISWAAMIAGYAQNGLAGEALGLFAEMVRDGGRTTRSSYTCVLSACGEMAALELGRQLHGRLVKVGFEEGCYLTNALLVMYSKCGSIDEAAGVFGEMGENKDVVSFNTMIAGYARHGFGREALGVFDEMRAVGIAPDEVTMVGVLSACSHAGLVDKGTEYFQSMSRVYGIHPQQKHYTCMIDLLGRAGRLDEAQNLIKNMPIEPDGATWGALLGASRIHGNTELGEKAAKRIFELEPENAGMYVLLSNLYASTGRWSDVRTLRTKMRDSGAKKVPGYSWVEVQNVVHTFSVGDTSHPRKEEIYAYLEELDLEMKREGFVSSTRLVLHDVEEEEKENMLRYHSEKLALAFALLSAPSGRTIRVMKNLRVCEDCHNAFKIVSKIAGRLIVLRDSYRFHHFSDGSCSCGNYW